VLPISNLPNIRDTCLIYHAVHYSRRGALHKYILDLSRIVYLTVADLLVETVRVEETVLLLVVLASTMGH